VFVLVSFTFLLFLLSLDILYFLSSSYLFGLGSLLQEIDNRLGMVLLCILMGCCAQLL
jgi:hypothetical protein